MPNLHFHTGDRVTFSDIPGRVVTVNHDAAKRAGYLYLVKLDQHVEHDPEVGPVRTEWFRADQLTASTD